MKVVEHYAGALQTGMRANRNFPLREESSTANTAQAMECGN